MKTKLSILTVLLASIFLSSCSMGNRMTTMRGDGNVVRQVINIADYDGITVRSAGDVIYTQNDAEAPFLSIDIDNNLMEHTHIRVENNTLIIAPQEDINLSFTKFVIRTNSKSLRNILISGSGNVLTNGKINTENLEVKISGSGNININELDAKTVKGSIAGSGDINLKGSAINTSYNIAGSGNVNTKELTQDIVQCNIAGSGNITVNAEKSLSAKIAGSGDIYYTGNASVDTSVAGSGKVKRISL